MVAAMSSMESGLRRLPAAPTPPPCPQPEPLSQIGLLQVLADSLGPASSHWQLRISKAIWGAVEVHNPALLFVDSEASASRQFKATPSPSPVFNMYSPNEN